MISITLIRFRCKPDIPGVTGLSAEIGERAKEDSLPNILQSYRDVITLHHLNFCFDQPIFMSIEARR